MLKEIIVLLSAHFVNQFYRSFLAVVSPSISRDFDINIEELGDLSATWFIVFAISQIPVGLALDRWGAKRTISPLMVIAALGALLFSQSTSYPMAQVSMALIGLGCSPIYMGALFYIGKTRPLHEFAMLNGIIVGLGSIGNIAAAAPLTHMAAMIGWRYSILSIGAITLISAIAVHLVLKDTAAGKEKSGAEKGSFFQIFKIPALWFIFPLNLVNYAVVAAERGIWIVPYLRDTYSITLYEAANHTFIMATGMAIGALASGMIAKAIGGTKWLVVGAGIIVGGSFIALGTVLNLPLWAASTLLASIGFFGMFYPLGISHGRQFIPDHILGRGITFMNFLSIGGVGLFQVLSGRHLAAQQFTQSAGDTAQTFSVLHIGFGAAVLGAIAIFVFVPLRKGEKVDTFSKSSA